MRKLFLSFTGTVGRLTTGKVAQEDLDNGLFYFGCTKEWAAAATEDEYCVTGAKPEIIRKALIQLRMALIKAEDERRMLWRTNDRENSFRELDRLLEQNGFSPVEKTVLFDPRFFISYHFDPNDVNHINPDKTVERMRDLPDSLSLIPLPFPPKEISGLTVVQTFPRYHCPARYVSFRYEVETFNRVPELDPDAMGYSLPDASTRIKKARLNLEVVY